MPYLKLYGWEVSAQQLADFAARHDFASGEQDENEYEYMNAWFASEYICINIDDLIRFQKGRRVMRVTPKDPAKDPRDCWELVGEDELVIGLWAEEAGQKPELFDKIKELFGFDGKAKTYKRYW